jgi:hypothetical protein
MKQEEVSVKKILKGALCAAAVFLTLVSCIMYPDAPKIWDETLPEEEMATIVFDYWIIITGYNGIPVDWQLCYYAKIPAGAASFDLDINTPYVKGSNLSFEYTFEGGKKYWLKEGRKDGLWGMYVYDVSSLSVPLEEIKKVVYTRDQDKSKYFIGFAPFPTEKLGAEKLGK